MSFGAQYPGTKLSRDIIALGISNFAEQKTVERTPIIQQNSAHGLSRIRTLVTETGNGTVTNLAGDGFYALHVDTSGDIAEKRTTRGRYGPGFGGEGGIGFALEAGLTGDQFVELGLRDDNEGFVFGWDANGLYIKVVRDGVQVEFTRQSGFNLNRTYTIKPTDPVIYQIEFTHYGAGPAEFQVIVTDESQGYKQTVIPVHRANATQFPSLLNPNLPLCVKLSAGTTNAAANARVGGMQYSVIGRYEPDPRFTGEYRISTGSVGTTFIPLISFRRKADYVQIPAQTGGYDIITQDDLILQVRLNGVLTGASYGTPSDHSPTETAFEVDKSATAISGGEVLYTGGAFGGIGNQGADLVQSVSVEIPERQPVTLCARKRTGTGGSIDLAVFRMIEEF